MKNRAAAFYAVLLEKLPPKLCNFISSQTFPQFVKFCLVGIFNTAVFYGIYYLLLQLGFSYIVAATAGTIAGILNSYIWNKIFVFRSKRRSIGEIIKFMIVYGVQYICNITVIHICVTYLGISEVLAGIPAIGIGMFISFLGMKFWSFRR